MNGNDAYARTRGRSSNSSEGSGRKTGFKGTAENAKTQVCTRWKNGDCRFGDRCNFAHGEQELRRLPGRGRGRGGAAAAGRGSSTARGAARQFVDKSISEPDAPCVRPAQSAASAASMSYGPAAVAVAGVGSVPSSTFSQPSHASPDSHASTHLTAGGILAGGSAAVAAGTPAPGVPENIWAACGYPLAGANGWVMYRVPETGESYYHHAACGITQWDQPLDFIEH